MSWAPREQRDGPGAPGMTWCLRRCVQLWKIIFNQCQAWRGQRTGSQNQGQVSTIEQFSLVQCNNLTNSYFWSQDPKPRPQGQYKNSPRNYFGGSHALREQKTWSEAPGQAQSCTSDTTTFTKNLWTHNNKKGFSRELSAKRETKFCRDNYVNSNLLLERAGYFNCCDKWAVKSKICVSLPNTPAKLAGNFVHPIECWLVPRRDYWHDLGAIAILANK